MSQYAPGHGQWPYDPSGFYPYPTNQPQTQQLPTPYHTTPSEPASSASYLTSQNSFGYNATQIPGLGFGGPSASTGNGPPQQPHQSWIPPPPPPANYQQQIPTTLATTLESSKISSQVASLPKPPVQNTQEAMEEGELSDADFDDLYDPQPEDVALPQPSTTNQKPRPVDHVRQNSYSPRLSPNEVSRAELPSTVLNGSGHGTKPSLPGLGLQKNPDITGNAPAQPSGAVPQFRSVDEAKKEAQKAILRLLPLGVKYQTYLDEGFDEATVKSLFNELNLLPPSVPVKPAVQPAKAVKPAPNSAAESDGSTPVTKDKTEERKDRIARLLAAKAAANKTSSVPATSSKPATAPSVPTPVPVSAAPPPDVETLPVASIPNAPAAMQNVPPPSAPTAPLALRKEMDSAAKPKFKADKEALLKKKLEALKSRQAQKQLAVTTPQPSKQPTPPAVESGSSISRPTSLPSTTLPGSSMNPVPNTPADGQPLHLVSSPSALNAAQIGSSIPGLSLSTGNLGLNSSRKRPVAADFVDYSATVGTPKRPYGQHRQGSFVIDISEDSDDDVEMEVDSPGGHSASSSSRVETPNRGPVVRDFPPLSDGTPRKSLTRGNSNVPPAKLSRLDSDILRMRAKIAAAEAKKRMAGSGSQTPDVTTSTPEFKEPTRSVDPTENTRITVPGQRAVSSSDVESTDLPSAQLISEAASASVSRVLEQAPQGARSKHGYGQLGVATTSPVRPTTQPAAAEGDRRTRITSLHLPKIEAKLLEKKTKLKLLEQKAAQLRREIEAEAAEREKLAEELLQLDDEPADSNPPSEAVIPQQQQQPVEQDSNVQLPQPSDEAHKATENCSVQVPQTSSAPLADAQDSGPMQLDAGKTTPEELAPPQKSPKEKTIEPTTTVFANNDNDPVKDQDPTTPIVNAPLASKSPEPRLSASKESPQIDIVMASTTSTPESGQIDESEPPSPRDTNSGSTSSSSDESQLQFETTPAPAIQTISGERAEGSPDVPMISDVVHANDDTERTVDVNGEAPTDRDDEVPSFTPYESPLTYFRAYRFHPKYAETVTGGLKSLTYTNKINPKQALCLNELTQKKCNDPECGFQHFKSMVPRDDQILMELGQADDFADGEEKSRFITGLRDLLAECRAQKVRDMDEIGRAIIEYRRKFIGDQSRVLTSLQDTKV
ncbi:uncharacterized protein PpBr36_09467 [Pyricularia pennisetigena]|uniref:uncharacterized protein n=1 Tax=Pyricularia pennisetigena TaxID=1578925 RepID=UPI0011528E59|nr:uncharacterized protein PpBr36_09467 [Pyricularia pennisetigena]TLS21973.1 hypothetical protein PpBr36_09467 [Pyricularia pennisetigena]